MSNMDDKTVDITERLYSRAGCTGSKAEGVILLDAHAEIIRLRNQIGECIHGSQDCEITDEGCRLCIAGNDLEIAAVPVADEVRILNAMGQYGGGFVKKLAACWINADLPNQARLRMQFRHIFADYRKFLT